MDSWIDSYVGEWKDAAGNRLSIRKITDETARVTFLVAPGNAPIVRHWYHDRSSVDMPARYYPAHGPELIVELWEEGKGFALELCYEIRASSRRAKILALNLSNPRPRVFSAMAEGRVRVYASRQSSARAVAELPHPNPLPRGEDAWERGKSLSRQLGCGRSPR